MQVNSSKDCRFTARPRFRAVDLTSVHLSTGSLPSNKYHLEAGRNEGKKGIRIEIMGISIGSAVAPRYLPLSDAVLHSSVTLLLAQYPNKNHNSQEIALHFPLTMTLL